MNLNHVEVYAAPLNEKETITNLMQFYAYDFSEYMDIDIEKDGLYASYHYLNDYWTEPDIRFPYLFKVNGKHAAITLFDLHSGPWEVFQIKTNIPAQYFWNKVISEYTKGQFTEHDEQGEKTQGFVAGR